MKPNIVYEDSHLLVCEKPSGIPSQSSRVGVQDMVSILKNYLFEKENKKENKGEPYLGLVHRLDQPVQGVMVFAKSPFAAKELSRQVTSFSMKKYYLAVISGETEKDQGTLIDYLLKNGQKNLSKVVSEKTPGAKRAELNYQVLGKKDRKELLEIELITGRHHQIRVQFSSRNMPLWGDAKYGSSLTEEMDTDQIALCGYRLEFIHPKTKKGMDFQIVPRAPIFKIFKV